jgi:hypothetical protein
MHARKVLTGESLFCSPIAGNVTGVALIFNGDVRSNHKYRFPTFPPIFLDFTHTGRNLGRRRFRALVASVFGSGRDTLAGFRRRLFCCSARVFCPFLGRGPSFSESTPFFR